MARLLTDNSLDALLVTSGANRRYLSGFTAEDTSFWSSAGWLLVAADRCLLLTGFNYFDEAQEQVQAAEVIRASGKLTAAAAEAIKAAGYRRVGFEPDYLAVSQHLELLSSLEGSAQLVPTTDLVESLRVVKDEAELAAIRRASEITDAAMAHIYQFVRPGVTEKQAVWELERFMREQGADGLAFQPHVAAGPAGATPHATPSDRPVAEGEPIVVDIGARYDGYCADLTRTFCLGAADERYREVWGLVARAQGAALAGIRANLTGREADALARDVIVEAGHGEQFGHSLGHGVGLVIHEPPRVSPLGTAIIPAGSVVTVEPGVYLPGWGGVRIEDLVVVTEDRVEVLSHAPKLDVIPL